MYYDFYSIENSTGNNSNIINHIETKYKENIKKNKSIFATIIARHDREGQRTKIWNTLSKYEGSHGKIISAGDFRNNSNKIGSAVKDKINHISQGIYNICPENSLKISLASSDIESYLSWNSFFLCSVKLKLTSFCN